MARSAEARVFEKANGARYGCLYATGKRRLVATAAKPLRAIRAGGPFVAFSQASFHDGATDNDIPWEVFSVGLCRGDARRFKYIIATTRVTDLVVSRHGDIAWIAKGDGGYVIYKADGSTENPRDPTVVAGNRHIDPDSLKVSGTRIKWVENGEPAMDRLRPRVSVCRAAR